jgi:hypothetical protein
VPKGKSVPLKPAENQNLLDFFMRRMLSTRVTKLFGLHPVRMLLFIFRGRVVAVLALAALQCNDFAHFLLSSRALTVPATTP